jgi:N-dimethylarginine dimethylaminohydrolase
LPVYWLTPSVLITLLDYLAKSAVVGICVRRIKLRTVEEVEVIHLQDTCNTLAEKEALSYIRVLVVQALARL